MYDRIEAAGANAKFTVNGVAPSKKLAKIAQLIVKKYGAHVRQEGQALRFKHRRLSPGRHTLHFYSLALHLLTTQNAHLFSAEHFEG